ncbi:TAXI family TRAP transporter solute-binding subunit [Nocardia sp. CA-129566]|uniref:TAXI family TRAP transporter solute-binding subunit n=1 Tax=Nocardia sp. CA-129566 TaxID=3239976 RepID=UPI003D9704B6
MTAGVRATAEPRIERDITLQFRADWGQANMTRICGWLAQEIGDRSGVGSRFATWAGRGGRDQTDALLAGEVDITVMTPAAAVRLVFDGSGPIGVGPQPSLRALGSIAHRDRLVIAVDASLPVHTVADLAKVADQLVIATCAEDGINTIGMAAHHGLRLAGADPEMLVANGARFMYWERPFPALHAFTTGQANVLINEAIMMPVWQQIADRRPVRYLDWGDDVIDGFAELGWGAATVDAGYLPGLESDLRTLDFADLVVLCRADLPDDIAYLATWCMVQQRKALEAQYIHMDPDHTPVGYPLDPATMAKTPVPLHPAAQRAYADLAQAKPATDGLIWS